MNHRQLLAQLASFRRLKKLVLLDGSLLVVPDAFLAGLVESHPDLVYLHIGAMKEAFERGNAFTTNGLSRLFEGCTRLEDLRFVCPPGVRTIPPSISSQFRLRRLSLTAHRIQHLPEAFTSLQLLEILELCMEELRDLPQNFGSLVALKSLHLKRVRSLRSLPTSVQQLANLHHLSIQGCGTFQLPGGLSKLPRLKELELENCADLLPLPALENLRFLDVKGITELPETVGLLQQLQILTIKSYSTNFSSLPRTLPDVSSLTSLDLRVHNLSGLPDGIGRLSKLQTVKLESYSAVPLVAPRISSLPDDFGQLTALKILHLSYLGELSHLPESLGHLLKLRELEISYCDQLQQLPNSFTQLSSLHILKVEHCPKLTAIPEGLGDGMCHLRELRLVCNGLSPVPGSFSRLSSLEVLHIVYSEFLGDCLSESFNSFTRLRHLSLSDIPNLTSLPTSLSRMALTLTSLKVAACEELKALPEEIGQLVMLEKLELSSLDGWNLYLGRC
ncbi:unnamed protein product [Closterium sp. Yama58-4]|nr:unnamed protein product [Closterium sp. Yama58-4]